VCYARIVGVAGRPAARLGLAGLVAGGLGLMGVIAVQTMTTLARSAGARPLAAVVTHLT
jgi:hypothetical protein